MTKKVCMGIGLILILSGLCLLGYLVKGKMDADSISNKGTMVLSEFDHSLSLDVESDVNDVVTIEEGDSLIPTLQEVFSNNSIIAYLYFPEASISYPVVQGSDNYEYLRRDIYKNYASAGSIFLDCDNSSDFSDLSSIIYGHHMRDGSMFGLLEDSMSDGIEGKEFYIYTRDKKLTYKVIAETVLEPDERDSFIKKDGLSTFPVDFLNTLKGRSFSYCASGDEIQFVTLLTCHYISKRTVRYGLTGALVSEEPY